MRDRFRETMDRFAVAVKSSRSAQRKPSLLLRLTALTHCSIIHNAVFCVMGLANNVEAFRYGIAQKHQRKKLRP